MKRIPVRKRKLRAGGKVAASPLRASPVAQKSVTAILLHGRRGSLHRTIESLRQSDCVKEIVLLSPLKIDPPEGCSALRASSPDAMETIRAIAAAVRTRYVLFVTDTGSVDFVRGGLDRVARVMDGSGAGLAYGDCHDGGDGIPVPHPLNDYQLGSIRDDFDFGPAVMVDALLLRQSMLEIGGEDYRHAGRYALRLSLSRHAPLLHLPEFLSCREAPEARSSHERQFSYVDPLQGNAQKEMEHAATAHLRKIGALLDGPASIVDLDEGTFPVHASIIIPVKNRRRVISDAVSSALRQLTPFSFNVIVVDNHSTDGTEKFLDAFARRDARLIHVVPDRTDLGIGGCWNEGIAHPACGRFVVQLDSDDLYMDETTLQKMVDVFYREKCAMAIGSYRMTNLQLREIPPGIVDHREWTADNGRNNALRVNGFGAPRAFFTPIIRRIGFPNISYGEDYAVCLAISRHYHVARIFEPVYYCRRWEGNSDASPDDATRMARERDKDTLRTAEILIRQKLNGGEK